MTNKVIYSLLIASTLIWTGCNDEEEPIGAVCGNNVVEGSEECDGGANCNTDCTLQDDTPPPDAECGNDVVEDGEECDGGEDCNDDCTLQDNPPPPDAECGNNVVEDGEECDGDLDADGNEVECNDACEIVPDNEDPVCGDGNVDVDIGEACDEGDGDEGNGTIDSGCNVFCQEIPASCGDGNEDDGEECDDVADVACREDCTLAVCGDGIPDDGEECDDGNNDDGDDCSAICEVEPFCGDENVDVDIGETCDSGLDADGNPVDCDDNCQIVDNPNPDPDPNCGDGTVDAGEECDNENENGVPGNACSDQCTFTSNASLAIHYTFNTDSRVDSDVDGTTEAITNLGYTGADGDLLLTNVSSFPSNGALSGAISIDNSDNGEQFGVSAKPLPISGDDARTVSMWVRTATETEGLRTVASFGENLGNGQKWDIDLDGATVELGVGNGRTDGANTDEILESFSHIVTVLPETPNGVATLSDVEIYVNGASQAVATNAGDREINTNNAEVGDGEFNLQLGRSVNTTARQPFTGDIDDVAVWDRALSNIEVSLLGNIRNSEFNFDASETNKLFTAFEAASDVTVGEYELTYVGDGSITAPEGTQRRDDCDDAAPDEVRMLYINLGGGNGFSAVSKDQCALPPPPAGPVDGDASE